MPTRLLTFAGLICAAAIIYLSLVPGALRPHTAMPKDLEHFVAYLGTGFLLCCAARSALSRIAATTFLITFAAFAEAAQRFIPARTGDSAGFLASSAGAVAGLICGLIMIGIVRDLRTFVPRR
ncbi:MAG: VanZ family protein [Hyphomicrobiales bacterium]|nr:VanZ family protein [Hyphomicrobiales bacterium]